MAEASGLRWLERLISVAVGSLLTAWWMRDDVAVQEPAASAAALAAVSTRAEPSVTAITEPVGGPALAAATQPARTADPPIVIEADAGTPVDPLPPAPIDRAALPASGDGQPVDDAAAPVLELPRMPGSTRLSDASRYDAPSETWVLRAAYRVHAREHHVVAFYSKALADAGLALTSAREDTAADGTVITYVYGRSTKVRAQVSVRTQPGELEARIGILWRVRR